MSKEYRRTCERCGTEWYIPKEYAKERTPNKLEIMGAKMQSAGASMTPGIGWLAKGGKRREVERLEEKQRRVLDNSRCPSCGSVSFVQTDA